MMTGIEQVGYLTDLPKPIPSPTLRELGDLYADRVDLSSNEASRSKLFWNEFVGVVDAATVRDIDHDGISRYEREMRKRELAPKSILHRYRKVRAILSYAIKRGRGLADCRRALDRLLMLEVKGAHPIDPRPISPETFWKLHAAASKNGDRQFASLMLMALNACMYPGEVAALKWKEIDLKAGELNDRA